METTAEPIAVIFVRNACSVVFRITTARAKWVRSFDSLQGVHFGFEARLHVTCDNFGIPCQDVRPKKTPPIL
jgi:hypothetical protein